MPVQTIHQNLCGKNTVSPPNSPVPFTRPLRDALLIPNERLVWLHIIETQIEKVHSFFNFGIIKFLFSHISFRIWLGKVLRFLYRGFLQVLMVLYLENLKYNSNLAVLSPGLEDWL